MYEPYILALSAEPPLLCPHNRGSSERAGLWRDHLSPALLDDSQLDKNIEYQPIRCRQNLGHSAVSRIYQQGGHWRVVDNRCGGDCFRFEAAEFPTTNVDGAVSALFDRIAAINRDSNSQFRITQAVAFGDCVTGRATIPWTLSVCRKLDCALFRVQMACSYHNYR
jgi:hypothetical protein